MMRRFTIVSLVAAMGMLIACDRGEPSAGDIASMPVSEPPMPASTTSQQSSASLLNFTMNDIREQPVDLSKYEGKVVMFVNVASECGLTPQYTGLQALYEKYKDQGLVIIGVPANNFGGQEPGTNEEVLEFCTTNYSVTFPMLAKVSVKGDDICPLYRALIDAAEPTGETGDVQWNFEKFLLDRNGRLIHRFRPKVTPDDPQLVSAIEAAL